MKAESGQAADLKKYLKLSRAGFLISSLLPVILALSAALYGGYPVSFRFLPPLLAGVLAAHALTNITNEYFDYKRGVDASDTEGKVHLLVSGKITPGETAGLGLLSFIIALGSLIFLSLSRGPLLFIAGAAGITGGYFYSAPPFAYKYRALGEPLVFMLMGPLLVSGSHYALTGNLSALALGVSLIPGSLICAVLTANNLRDIRTDREAGIITLAVKTGERKAALIYSGLLFFPFILTAALSLTGLLPPYSITVLLFIPKALKAHLAAHKKETVLMEKLDLSTLRVYAGVTLLLSLSLLAGALA